MDPYAELSQGVPEGWLRAGQLVFRQPAEGYRAPVDGLLLAAFAGAPRRVVVDLGAGAGMVTLALLADHADCRLIAVERDEAMVSYLTENIAANGFEARAAVVPGDVESVARGRRGCADLVVANPPYWRSDGATAPRHPRARSARMAEQGSALPSFVRAARLMLGRGGRACFVWPSSDLADFLAVAASAGLYAKRLRFVHASATKPAHRMLVEFKPGRAGGAVVEPPLYLLDALPATRA